MLPNTTYDPAPLNNLPNACPLITKWFKSNASVNWISNGNTTVEPAVADFLFSTWTASGITESRIMSDRCVHLETSQSRISLIAPYPSSAPSITPSVLDRCDWFNTRLNGASGTLIEGGVYPAHLIPPKWSIRCRLESDLEQQGLSVNFSLLGPVNYTRSHAASPYTLCGNGLFRPRPCPWTMAPGKYRLVVAPQGVRSVTIRFTVTP